MSMRTFFLFFVIVINFSCKLIIANKFHVNKHRNFRLQSEYLSYIKDNKLFPSNSVLYFDSTSYQSFLGEVQKNEFSIYYDAYINDSLKLKKSLLLSENISCIGRIVKEINTSAVKQLNSSDTEYGDFKQYKLSYITTGKGFEMDNVDGKIKIFLLYSYKLGTLFNEGFKEVMRAIAGNESKFNIYIVLLDDFSRLR